MRSGDRLCSCSILPAKSVCDWKPYLPHNDFRAALKNGLGRIALVQKKYTAKLEVSRPGQRGKDGHPENLLVRRRQSRTGVN